MEGRGQSEPERAVVYCVIPTDLAATLHDQLRRHFRDDQSVEVIVEQRAADRRATPERRATTATPATDEDRRRIRSRSGRRFDERRATTVEVTPPDLPRRARAHADRIAFIERIEPSTQHAEDVDTARLVTRFQAGDQEAFATLYMRYFDRVYGYLRIALGRAHDAEDVTQQVFTNALEALPRYERRSVPFRAWLFTIAKNRAITHLRRYGHGDLEATPELPDPGHDEQDHYELPETGGSVSATLKWISDPDLLLFVERLPLAQRQVLVMRYMLGLNAGEIASVLDWTPNQVRKTQQRAQDFLRERLAAVGRAPARSARRVRVRVRPRQALVVRARRFMLHS